MPSLKSTGHLFEDNMLTHKVVMQCIEPRFKKEVVREDAPVWVTTKYTQPSIVYEVFKALREESKEHFIVLHLDTKNRIACKETVSIGSLDQSIVHPREVFKTALLSNAASIILIHNHPSGDTQPSTADLVITKRLSECGQLLGIKVLDHIIIGDSFYSMTENGQI